MSNIWFSSDWHFGHVNFLNFVDDDGNKVRPFSSVEEMNEVMIERHNALVKPNDTFYTLGDVCFDKNSFHSIMTRLNGKKSLILGNHDSFATAVYAQHFKKIKTSFRPMRNVIFSHHPLYINPDQAPLVNIHGHTHWRKLDTGNHINICVEQTDYSPIHYDQLIVMADNLGHDINNNKGKQGFS